MLRITLGALSLLCIVSPVVGVDDTDEASFISDGDVKFDLGPMAGGKRKVVAKAAAKSEDDDDDDVVDVADVSANGAKGKASLVPIMPVDFYEDGGGTFVVEDDDKPDLLLSKEDREWVLPPGRIIVFPADVQIRSMALAVGQGGIVVVDGAIHGDRRRALRPAAALQTWWERIKNFSIDHIFPGKSLPYPSAYLVSSRGSILRNMEFVEAGALPLGAAESPSGRIAFTFYQGRTGIEVWEASLATKNTYHDVFSKPALVIFDSDELLWVPCTIADRLNEEGDKVAVILAYRSDGSRWEAFTRRQLSGVKFPHSLRFESNFLVVAGLKEWAFQDGIYGPQLKGGLVAGGAYTAIDFYALVDETAGSYGDEQDARYAEREKLRLPLDAVQKAAARKVPLASALELRASYNFPTSLCLWPLFALMGDGHAITACHGQTGISILRYADPSTDPPESPTVKTLVDKAAPPLPPGFASLQLRDTSRARVVAEFSAPWGVGPIMSLQADPSGLAFLVADTRCVFSVPWPMKGLEVGVPEPLIPLTLADGLPAELKFNINVIPRSS